MFNEIFFSQYSENIKGGISKQLEKHSNRKETISKNSVLILINFFVNLLHSSLRIENPFFPWSFFVVVEIFQLFIFPHFQKKINLYDFLQKKWRKFNSRWNPNDFLVQIRGASFVTNLYLFQSHILDYFEVFFFFEFHIFATSEESEFLHFIPFSQFWIKNEHFFSNLAQERISRIFQYL